MPTPLKPPSPWPGRLAGGCFIGSLLILGFLAGILVATRVFTTSAMGWDQLADALGGAAAGALAGVAVGALLVRRLGVRRRIVLALLALAGALLCFLYLRATPPRVGSYRYPDDSFAEYRPATSAAARTSASTRAMSSWVAR